MTAISGRGGPPTLADRASGVYCGHMGKHATDYRRAIAEWGRKAEGASREGRTAPVIPSGEAQP
jgi:hypothetical protein